MQRVEQYSTVRVRDTSMVNRFTQRTAENAEKLTEFVERCCADGREFHSIQSLKAPSHVLLEITNLVKTLHSIKATVLSDSALTTFISGDLSRENPT